MMKKEFEMYSRVRVTDSEYQGIEADYMDSSFQGPFAKQDFVNDWIKNDGLRKLLSVRLDVVVALNEKIDGLNREVDSARASSGEWMSEFYKMGAERNALESKLNQIKEALGAI